ncbi:DNA-directed RNA polymerase I subunit RPA34.5-domain-containing protein [Durotheca rogersii]|uniref:DNA-directed RNA polymerase I subunit RPA34.5-domain-containing protein n=1 Tax=Durotheca rogersii TaxID=419775 RepID=UPI002220B816|nr:DNA-directed RNA polymerase I subunit RPA34.5-domain-containing protein [Durotheca rogersii]KAI5863956.1 DNA-directed RNA polymerase I subunit RPA34.5-domain-containing protein [Durotheca rogersii]
MAKSRSSAPLGSLEIMRMKVANKKAADSKSSTIRSSQAKKSQAAIQDSNTSSEGSDSEGSGSDSDSDVDIDHARLEYEKKQAEKLKKAIAKPGLNSAETKSPHKTETPPRTAESTTPKTKITDTAKSKPESTSDSESSPEISDSNDEDDAHPGTKPKKSKREAAKGKDSDPAREASNEGESEGESEDGDAKETQEKKASAETKKKKAGAETKKAGVEEPTRTDTSSEGQSEEESEEESEEGIPSVPLGPNPGHLSSRPAWLNGSDFTLRKASSDNPAKEVTDFFSKANLEGKQVWYFTAPASLPITVIKDMEIDLSKATTGGSILNYKGDNYGLDIESQATSTQIQLFIPSRGGDSYTALNRGIDSTVHLRRIAKFGPGGAVSATAADDYVPTPKPVREQPQGLKPRFTPIGVPHSNPTLPAAPLQSRSTGAAQQAAPVGSESERESESESQTTSDSEEVTITLSKPPTSSSPSKKKATSSGTVSKQLKRKQPADEAESTPANHSQPAGKTTKRPRTTATKAAAPVPPSAPSRAALTPNGAPPKTSKASKASKVSKVSKAPGSSARTKTPQSRPEHVLLRYTPVPTPTIPNLETK